MALYSTGIIGSGISRCADIADLKREILPLLKDQRSAWMEKIEQILAENNYSCRQLAQLCRVSEPAVRKWRRGSLPQSRDMYLRIGFAAGYDLDAMNSFLMRYGRCPQLYIKSPEDAVCIFVLRSEYLEHTYETYLRVLDMVRDEFREIPPVQSGAHTTGHLSRIFSNLTSLEEMVEFVHANTPSYKQAYARLYSYIIAYLHVNLQSEHILDGDGRKSSFHAMASEARWSSSLRHCISEIRNKRWFPLRHKVISLGLHLNMDAEAINRMLLYAQMEPLYPGNPIEAAVIWAINEAKLCSENDELIPDGSSELCEFVKDVLLQLDLMEEGSYLIDDL